MDPTFIMYSTLMSGLRKVNLKSEYLLGCLLPIYHINRMSLFVLKKYCPYSLAYFKTINYLLKEMWNKCFLMLESLWKSHPRQCRYLLKNKFDLPSNCSCGIIVWMRNERPRNSKIKIYWWPNFFKNSPENF